MVKFNAQVDGCPVEVLAVEKGPAPNCARLRIRADASDGLETLDGRVSVVGPHGKAIRVSAYSADPYGSWVDVEVLFSP